MSSHEGRDPEDEKILAAVRALQAGAGPDAFDPIAPRLLKSLIIFFANQPALRNEARDLAQITLMRALENIHQYRFEAKFSTWLRRIAMNVWINAVRDQQTAKRGAPVESLDMVGVESEGERPVLQIADPSGTPEQAVLAREKVVVLRAALERLPPGMRRCMELRLFTDLKYREIAERMGIGIGSVKSQLSEAKQHLKPVLDEYFQGVEL